MKISFQTTMAPLVNFNGRQQQMPPQQMQPINYRQRVPIPPVPFANARYDVYGMRGQGRSGLLPLPTATQPYTPGPGEWRSPGGAYFTPQQQQAPVNQRLTTRTPDARSEPSSGGSPDNQLVIDEGGTGHNTSSGSSGGLQIGWFHLVKLGVEFATVTVGASWESSCLWERRRRLGMIFKMIFSTFLV